MLQKTWIQIFFVSLVTVLLISCSNKHTPEEAALQYIEAWNAQDFETMYEQLSEQTKETLDKETFLERHEAIYSGIRLTNIEVELSVSEDGLEPSESGEVEVPYQMNMDTLAGELSYDHQFTLVQETIDDDERWAIQWEPSLIFPEMEQGDKVRVETWPAKRGEIVDRNGEGLAVNGKALNIGIVPERLPEDERSSFEQMADILNISVESIEEKRHAAWVRPDTFVPVMTISKEDERLDSLLEIDGVSYLETDARIYPLKEAAAHLIGYVQEINAEELEELKDEGYQAGDQIGKNGLENILEERLRGQDGGRIYITDEQDVEKHEVAKREPVNGETITLTIDRNTQQVAYEQLKDEAGTVTAIHPKTGEVLALVNSPSYDPNQFVLGLSNEQWQTWNDDPAKPLLNRFATTYAPGSVLKPITGAIALEAGAIDEDTTIELDGLTWQKDESWGSYHITRVTDPRKPVDFQTALVLSDNIYFAQATLKTGEQALLDHAKQFGFDEPLPFEYPIYTSTFVNESFENDIQLADSGYGQGQVEMSILHTAIAYTPFVNEGNLIAPILIKNGENEPSTVWKEAVIEKETATLINEALIQVVHHPDGTGSDAKISGKRLAGKTGTSELKQSQQEEGQENGFFVAYDSDEPDLLIAMLVENVEGRGGSKLVVSKVGEMFNQLRSD